MRTIVTGAGYFDGCLHAGNTGGSVATIVLAHGRPYEGSDTGIAIDSDGHACCDFRNAYLNSQGRSWLDKCSADPTFAPTSFGCSTYARHASASTLGSCRLPAGAHTDRGSEGETPA